MIPAVIPMDLWSDFLGVLNAAMEPLYWAVSGILVLGHWVFSQFMDPNSGWTWVLSIVLLTVVIRSLMIPLFVRQINSQRKMQLLGPKIKELQKQYGHDRELMAQKQMALYKEEGVNPMASCLPLLVQMPIFISLFTVLSGAANGVAHGAWLLDRPEIVSSLQNAEIFGARLSQRFWPITEFGNVQILALVLIILMTGILFMTQLQLMSKNMPPEAMDGPMAQQQRMMLYTFPLVFAVGGVSMPIGVLIYWLTSNLWTMGQQYILIHNNPAPGTPAHLAWEDRMRAKGRDPEAILAKRQGRMKGKGKAATTVSATGVVRQARGGSTTSNRRSQAEPVVKADTSTKDTGAVKRSSARTDKGKSSSKKAAPASTPKSDSSTDNRQQVRRQQPSRQSRARRKGGPQAGAGNTKESAE